MYRVAYSWLVGLCVSSLHHTRCSISRQTELARGNHFSPGILHSRSMEWVQSLPRKVACRFQQIFQWIWSTMSNSKDYPFLDDEPTVRLIEESKTLFFLQLPVPVCDSLAHSITEVYGKDICVLLPRSTDQEAEIPQKAEKQCAARRGQYDRSLVEACKADSKVVMIADPNLTEGDLKEYQKIALSYFYQTIRVDPSDQEEGRPALYPLFYGWFMNEANSKKLREFGDDVYNECLNNEKFSEEFKSFLIKDEKGNTPDPRHYFSSEAYVVGPVMLHCTAFFSNYGQVADTEKYASSEPVRKAIGKAFQVEVIGLLITPRSLGARLKLSKDELPPWHEEDGSSTDPAVGGEAGAVLCRTPDDKCIITPMSPTCGMGSRAHFSMGSGPDIQAVQTGVDLVQLIEKEQEVAKKEAGDKPLTIQLDCGKARCYGKGNWVVYFDKPRKENALFSSFF